MPNLKPEEFKLGHYLSFRFFGFRCVFLGGYLREWRTTKAKRRTGKRGQNVVRIWWERGGNVVVRFGV
jgi:hypothetical protein